EARFVWIERARDRPRKSVGFDFDGAPFTHVGNRVTFEVLLASFGLDHDPALATLGAAVHFLDIGGVPVPDAKGLETLLRGIKEKARSDDALLAEAMRIFDHFYSAYATSSRS
ncbi:MAG: chromate resistance protein, partial [Betaproteobacteria bacterium]